MLNIPETIQTSRANYLIPEDESMGRKVYSAVTISYLSVANFYLLLKTSLKLQESNYFFSKDTSMGRKVYSEMIIFYLPINEFLSYG